MYTASSNGQSVKFHLDLSRSGMEGAFGEEEVECERDAMMCGYNLYMCVY